MFDDFSLDIPKELENLQLPAPELLSFYRDMQNRIIWVDFEIDANLLEVVKMILRFNAEDTGKPIEERKPIHMLIHSSGGDLVSTYACIDVMMASETPIVTVNMGMALSGGFLLLLGGSKRYTLSRASAMYHAGSAGFEGTAAQIETVTKHYNIQLKQMKDYILERTTMDARTYNKYKDADGWMDANTQVKFGVVHDIVSDISNIIGGV